MGEFQINFDDSGEATFKESKYLGIIEAKMGSPLSKGTTNAPQYNQVSRNVCCLASQVPDDCKIFFFVAAPAKSWIRHRKKAMDSYPPATPTAVFTR